MLYGDHNGKYTKIVVQYNATNRPDRQPSVRTHSKVENLCYLMIGFTMNISISGLRAELGVIFGLSWLITWYSHVMDNLMVILRLYDFFIATHPLMPIYVGAIVMDNRI